MRAGKTSLAPDSATTAASSCAAAREALGQDCDTLNMLMFAVGGVRFAIDADQVAEIADYQCGRDPDLLWFHEELGYGAKAVEYQSPAVLSIRCKAEPYRVIVDALEDIAAFSTNELRVLPNLLEPFALRRGVWGVLLRNNKIILLLDFMRLQRAGGTKGSDTCEAGT